MPVIAQLIFVNYRLSYYRPIAILSLLLFIAH